MGGLRPTVIQLRRFMLLFMVVDFCASAIEVRLNSCIELVTSSMMDWAIGRLGAPVELAPEKLDPEITASLVPFYPYFRSHPRKAAERVWQASPPAEGLSSQLFSIVGKNSHEMIGELTSGLKVEF